MRHEYDKPRIYPIINFSPIPMESIPPFTAQQLEASCKVLADTDYGLTGSEINYILQDCRLEDTSPQMTKRRSGENSGAFWSDY